MSDDGNSGSDECAATSSGLSPPSSSALTPFLSSHQDAASPSSASGGTSTGLSKRRKSDSRPVHVHLQQQNKCLNEKRRREQENVYIEELAELIASHLHDMSSLAVKPDKCAILQETVKQIRIIKQTQEVNADSAVEDISEQEDLQASEVSSSKPHLISTDALLGPLLLEALEGFLFVVNSDAKIEFVTENVEAFLSYKHSALVGESIYSIIHIGDHNRFSSNLLPMSALGGGFGWPETSSTSSSSSNTISTISSNNAGAAHSSGNSSSALPLQKSRQFNARFLKALEKGDKPGTSSSPLYESMQVCAIPVRGMTTSSGLDSGVVSSGRSKSGNESPNEEFSLVCVARRIPTTDNSPNSIAVEQFSTRLDLSGKVLMIDTSGVSSTYSQFLNKDLMGKTLLELCHPEDHHRVNDHLRATISGGSSNFTSQIYRLRLTSDRYVHVRTKSKRFACTTDDTIMSTHSIIKDSDSTAGTTAMVEVTSSFGYSVHSPSTSTTPTTTTTSNHNNRPNSNLPSDSNVLNDCLGLSEVALPSSSSSYLWESDPHSTHPVCSSGEDGPNDRTSTIRNVDNETEHGDDGDVGEADNSTDLANQKFRDSLNPQHEPGSVSDSVQSGDNILRDLLNAEEEDICDVKPSSASTSNAASRSATPLNISGVVSSGSTPGGQLVLNHASVDGDKMKGASGAANNMLRQLLNDQNNGEHGNVSRKRPSDEILIHQLLKDGDSSSASTNNCGDGNVSGVKRKMSDLESRNVPTLGVSSGGPRVTKQLAGQNPMLASMLAQTPRSLPPTVTIPTSIVSQVPQEKLPRNLEKKLIVPVALTAHEGQGGQTLYSMSINGQERVINETQLKQLQQQSFSRSQQQQQLQGGSMAGVQPVPTFVFTTSASSAMPLSDSLNHTTGHQAQQGYLNQILMGSTQPRSSPQLGTHSQQLNSLQHQVPTSSVPVSSSAFVPQHMHHTMSVNSVEQQQTPSSSTGGMPNGAIGMDALNEEPDPDLSSILDEVWSLQEDLQNKPTPPSTPQAHVSHQQQQRVSTFVSTTSMTGMGVAGSQGANMQATMLNSLASSSQVTGSDEVSANSNDDIFKLLDEVLETNAQQDGANLKDANEKAAILDIQKQLMSYEHTSTVNSTTMSGVMGAGQIHGHSSHLQHSQVYSTSPNAHQMRPNFTNGPHPHTHPAPLNLNRGPQAVIQHRPQPGQGPPPPHPSQHFSQVPITPPVVAVPRQSMPQNKQLLLQHRRLSAQGQQQSFQQMRQDSLMSPTSSVDNVPPNVTIQPQKHPNQQQQQQQQRQGQFSVAGPGMNHPLSPTVSVPSPHMNTGPLTPQGPPQLTQPGQLAHAQRSFPSSPHPQSNRMSPSAGMSMWPHSPQAANAGPPHAGQPPMIVASSWSSHPANQHQQGLIQHQQQQQQQAQVVMNQGQGNQAILSANPMLNAQLGGNLSFAPKPTQPHPVQVRYGNGVQRVNGPQQIQQPPPYGTHTQQPQQQQQQPQQLQPNMLPPGHGQQQQIRLQPRYPPGGQVYDVTSSPTPGSSTMQGQFFVDTSSGQMTSNSQAQFHYTTQGRPNHQNNNVHMVAGSSMMVNGPPQMVLNNNNNNNNSATGTSEYVKQEVRALVAHRSQSLTPNSVMTASMSQDLDDISFTLGFSSADPLIGGSPDSPLFGLSTDAPTQLVSTQSMAGTSRPASLSDDSRPISQNEQQKKSLLQQLLSEPS